MATHHPDTGVLLDYATGALAEPFALAVATHLALCPACRAEVARLEAVGGALLEDAESVPPGGGAFERLMARIEQTPAQAPRPAPVQPDAVASRVPRPLRDRLPPNSRSWPWRRRGGVDLLELEAGEAGFRVRLVRAAPGCGVPRHGHAGEEMTVVLEGGFSDAEGHYLEGDSVPAGPGVVHHPVADQTGPACA